MIGRVATRADRAVTSLAPGYFAITMASGIISVGSHLEGYEMMSLCLMWIAIAAFVILVVLTAMRFTYHRAEFVADFTGARRGFGYFTFIAAANVLAVRRIR